MRLCSRIMLYIIWKTYKKKKTTLTLFQVKSGVFYHKIPLENLSYLALIQFYMLQPVIRYIFTVKIYLPELFNKINCLILFFISPLRYVYMEKYINVMNKCF